MAAPPGRGGWPAFISNVVTVGDVEIDLARRRVTKGGRLVHLTQTEFALLRQFAVSPGVLLAHTTLLRRVWGPGYETQTEYTRVYVARLRAKLESPGVEHLFITEPRSGYRFALPSQDRAPLAASRSPA